MSRAAWNGYLPSGTGVPPTTSVLGPVGTWGRPWGPGGDGLAAPAEGAVSRLTASPTSSIMLSFGARRAWGRLPACRGPMRRVMGPPRKRARRDRVGNNNDVGAVA